MPKCSDPNQKLSEMGECSSCPAFQKATSNGRECEWDYGLFTVLQDQVNHCNARKDLL